MSPHGVNDLVISCIDYRFRAQIAAWIKDNLTDQSDLIAVAGAAKALIDATSQKYILNLIQIAVQLHGVTTVHILNHIDCGAYGGSKVHADRQQEQLFHAQQGELAHNVIAQRFPQLTVKSYIVDFERVQASEQVRV